jgi:hypothetical protein
MPPPGDLNGWRPWTDTLDDVTHHPIQFSDPHHVRHGSYGGRNLSRFRLVGVVHVPGLGGSSTCKVPLMNFVPSYILGVIGIFALHPVWLARLALVRFASPVPDSVRPKSGPG